MEQRSSKEVELVSQVKGSGVDGDGESDGDGDGDSNGDGDGDESRKTMHSALEI